MNCELVDLVLRARPFSYCLSAHQLGDSGAKLVLSSHEHVDTIVEACQEAGDCNILVLDKDAPASGGRQCIWDLVDEHEYEPTPLSKREAVENTTLLCYSSGTSGKPKVRSLY